MWAGLVPMCFAFECDYLHLDYKKQIYPCAQCEYIVTLLCFDLTRDWGQSVVDVYTSNSIEHLAPAKHTYTRSPTQYIHIMKQMKAQREKKFSHIPTDSLAFYLTCVLDV